MLNQIAADSELKGVQVFADHDPKVKVLYVTPANRKPQAGNFIQSNEARCETVKGLYDIAFHLPSYQTPEDLMRVAADQNAPVSAFFFLHFAGSIRHGDILNSIQQNFNDAEAMLDQNRPGYDRYLGTKAKFEAANKDTVAVQAEIQRLDDVIKRHQDQLLIATDQAAREAARVALDAAIAHKQQEYPNLARKLMQKEDAEVIAREEYVEAYQGVASLLENHRRMVERLDFNTRLYKARHQTHFNEYSMALSTLEARENRTIGSANVSVQVWADEAARVDRIVKSVEAFQDYSVQRLPIHNVSLDGRYWESKTEAADGSGTGYGAGEIQLISNNAAAAVGETESVESPFRDEEGRPVQMLVKKMGQHDAFAMNIPISAGTYCMARGKADEERIEFPVNHNGNSSKNVMTLRKFRPRPEPILKPSFALNYEYFVKAEPLNVACDLNMDLFFQHIQRSGSSGFLFWRKKWSSSELTQIQNNGLTCSVKSSPIGDDINLQREMEADLVEGFSRDLAAEAILLRAKEWKVSEASAELPGKSKGFAMIGTGMIAVCGGNPYCMVGSIVLKSIEELFGSQTATGQATYHYNTKLTRNFNYDGFTVDRGSVIVDTEIRQ
ncbi:MAG: hypothetical protein R3A80_11265 [Bdellovibrionota bacterium]